MRPRLLEPFCCAGGAAKGYQRAGFEVYGIDIAPQPRYAGDAFHQGDAVGALRRLLDGRAVKFTRSSGLVVPMVLGDFAAAHGSPPCQAHCDLQKQSKRFYEDFIPATRELFIGSDLPYIIENVEGAPLLDPVVLCGTMFPGLRVLRHLEPVPPAENKKRQGAAKTHCKRGHEYTPENTYRRPNLPNQRVCRTCQPILLAASQARRGVSA